MADPALSPFAPPPVPRGPREGPGARDIAAFLLMRMLALAVGPLTFSLIPVLMGLGSWERSLAAAAFGAALWMPSSFLFFRVLFFPTPPDPGLLDASGRPASARDLRTTLFASGLEHLLGTAPMVILVPWAWRVLEWQTALLATVALVGWVFWREVRGIATFLVRDAEILLAVGREEDALARVTVATRFLPNAGDAGALVLARARFRTGDARGAVAALDRIRDRDGYRVDLLRAQMGVAFLDRAEVVAARDAARSDPDTAGVAEILDGLLALHEHGALTPDLEDRLLSLADADGRRLARMLVAASRASADPAGARALLDDTGESTSRLDALCANWPAVGRAVRTLRAPHTTPGAAG